MTNQIYDNSEFLKKLSKNKDIYASYSSDETITWCEGCGNFAIQNALKRALTVKGFKPEDLIQCYDIGCNGNGSDKFYGYTYHGLHGRVISLAAGCITANPKMKVIAHGGDGGTLSEGINHLIHAVRSDYPILFLHHDNQNYALTTGQPSATTQKDISMNSAPDGVYTDPMDPIKMVLSLGPSFVARVYSGDIRHMTRIFRRALDHKGFAFIEIMQICPTYNRMCTREWYEQRIKYVEDIPKYDPANLNKVFASLKPIDKEITLGVLYENKEKKNFFETLPNRQNIKTTPVEEVAHFSIQKLLKEFN